MRARVFISGRMSVALLSLANLYFQTFLVEKLDEPYFIFRGEWWFGGHFRVCALGWIKSSLVWQQSFFSSRDASRAWGLPDPVFSLSSAGCALSPKWVPRIPGMGLVSRPLLSGKPMQPSVPFSRAGKCQVSPYFPVVGASWSPPVHLKKNISKIIIEGSCTEWQDVTSDEGNQTAFKCSCCKFSAVSLLGPGASVASRK